MSEMELNRSTVIDRRIGILPRGDLRLSFSRREPYIFNFSPVTVTRLDAVYYKAQVQDRRDVA